MSIITAPKADSMIYRAAYVPESYDGITRRLLLELVHKMQEIAVCGDDARRRLWITAERGPIEDYGSYEDYLADGEVETREEFNDWWLSEYPEPQKWYELITTMYKGVSYIFIDGKLLFQIAPDEKSEYELDWSDLAEWLLSAVGKCIETLKAGTYNTYVNENLPYRKRLGKILREKYWHIYVGEKEEYLKGITQEEIKRFSMLIRQQTENAPPAGRLSEMTAGRFFDCCRLGYEANQYDGSGQLSPKELYRAHADGRDDGLLSLPEDSREAFAEWFDARTMRGGHPWEVCRGGNSTHISLYVAHDEQGWWLHLAGSSYGRSVETVKFYLVLADYGLPVYLRDGLEIDAMLNGRDFIGIVPEKVIPRYCNSLFPGEKMLNFMNLPWEETEAIIEAAEWYPLENVFKTGDERDDMRVEYDFSKSRPNPYLKDSKNK